MRFMVIGIDPAREEIDATVVSIWERSAAGRLVCRGHRLMPNPPRPLSPPPVPLYKDLDKHIAKSAAYCATLTDGGAQRWMKMQGDLALRVLLEDGAEPRAAQEWVERYVATVLERAGHGGQG